ncbi:sigma-54-dependent transcriptional regulator [Schlesneria sp. DSM 10557]|uniref:sigma-54-dependent transcriptional regulator n=1 Tax=Schlesneria sp. DSM 10557 TaxID=3044399 RepID=UPI0035A0B039
MFKRAHSVLVVEDEDIIRTSLREMLIDEGYEVAVAASVAAALHQAKQRDYDVAICDVQLPDGDGLVLLRRLQQINPNISGLIITAYATVENAIEAFKSGAFDFLIKPVIFDDLANKLRRLFEYRELYLENQALRRELSRREDSDEIIGSSKAIQQVRDAIRKVAVTNANALLVGESGTGKELFARTIHKWGPKQNERFVVINCATRPESELDVLLFGTVTSAGEQPGLFRHVGQGTLYLDEVTQLPLATQGKLLRAIEKQEVTPVGGTETFAVNPRVIAATTHDLTLEIAAGRFQEDLFYRLDGVKICIPPLRERLDDIPELVEFFIGKHGRAMGRNATISSSDTIRLLMSAQWKGNVRQLDNAIERAVMMSEGTVVRPSDLPPDLRGAEQPLPDTDDLRSALRHYERLHILRVLDQFPDKREAAKRLKLGLSSLYRKIEELGIDL